MNTVIPICEMPNRHSVNGPQTFVNKRYSRHQLAVEVQEKHNPPLNTRAAHTGVVDTGAAAAGTASMGFQGVDSHGQDYGRKGA